MIDIKTTIRKLMLARAINNFGSSFSDFVLPLLVFQVTKSPSLMALQWGVSALAKFSAGKVAGRISYFTSNKNAIVSLDLLQGVATLLPLVLWSIAPTFGIFLSGVAVSFLMTIQTGYLDSSILKMTDDFENGTERRSEIIASLENSKYIGQFLGYWAALVCATVVGYKFSILIDSGTFFISGLITATIVDQSKHKLTERVSESFTLLFQGRALSLLTISQCLLSFSIFIFNSSYVFILRDRFNVSDAYFTLFLSLQAGSYILGSYFAKIFKTMSPNWNLVLRSVYCLIFLGFFFAKNFYQFLSLNCLMSLLISFTQPKILALFQEYTDIRHARSFGSSRVSLMSISGLLGSIFCATFAKLGNDYQSVYLFGALACGTSAFLFDLYIKASVPRNKFFEKCEVKLF